MKWEPFDWKILEKTRLSVIQNGLRSPMTQQMLRFIFTADLMIPQVIQQLTDFLLPPSQQPLFLKAWQRLCDLECAKPRQQNDPLYGIQTPILMGQGQYEDGNVQAAFAPAVLQFSQMLALQALLTLHEPGKFYMFTDIQQNLHEPYAQFIDRLYKAIANHPDMDGPMKQKMFNLLAFENANEKTKRVLGHMPKYSEVADMLELVERTQQVNNAAYIAAAVQGAVALLIPKEQKLKGGKKAKRCFKCGKSGHLKAQCKAVSQNQATGQAKWCVLCKKAMHNTAECCKAGNEAVSVKIPHAMMRTQGAWPVMAQPQMPQTYLTPSALPQVPLTPPAQTQVPLTCTAPPLTGVPEWTWKQQ
ncbi:hypothetical protein WISP_106271 [Willisornis vidua]|uniref:CCHC-type domain-containing protein n=1 Tax=Willisornis vidua TaxID=1566151 RepID=A0ABQ9D2W3_9PASS|nr:hypothetical protein WISP_106271 [Willisornis vidua]